MAAESVWISPNISNGKALLFYSSLGDVPPRLRGEVLRSEADRVGLKECPLADRMDASSSDVEVGIGHSIAVGPRLLRGALDPR